MRRLAAAGVLAWLLLGAATPRAAAAASCPPLDYLADLQHLQADLGATPPDVGTAAAGLGQMSAAYPDTAAVLGPIQRQLQAAPPDIAAARARLATLVAVLTLPPGSTCTIDQRPARDQLTQVYASPVFANLDHKPPGPNPVSQLLAWLGSLLRSLTRALGTAGTIALGAAILGAALALAAWRLRGVLAPRPVRAGEEPRADGVDPERLWSLALSAAQRGEHREAVRRAFRSALLAVAMRGRLSVDPSWTTHELLAATRGDAALLAALAPAAAAFDRAWYSGAAVTAADWEEARARCETVRVLARARSRATAA